MVSLRAIDVESPLCLVPDHLLDVDVVRSAPLARVPCPLPVTDDALRIEGKGRRHQSEGKKHEPERQRGRVAHVHTSVAEGWQKGQYRRQSTSFKYGPQSRDDLTAPEDPCVLPRQPTSKEPTFSYSVPTRPTPRASIDVPRLPVR